MREIIQLLGLVALCSTPEAFASHCYSDICHNKTADLRGSGPQCLLALTQRGKDCINLRFENSGLSPRAGGSLAKFRLSSYIKDFGKFQGRTTAFNLTISDAKFDKLIARYQNSGDYRQAACVELQVYGRSEETPFPEIFVSCPFAEESFEDSHYRLEYLVVGDHIEYSRKLVFVVPRHMSIDKNVNDVRTFTPFFYVDISNSGSLLLHIQTLPEEFNVTRYKVWLINNDTRSATSVELKLNQDQEMQHNFSVVEGVHFFKVAAMHPLCGEDGCVNSTSPAISTKQPTRRLLIMIISVVWIPPAIIYGMYYAYKVYMKKSLAKRRHRRTNCLLVYSPTHAAHIDVMQKLAVYMRSCNINAMIDMLDIPKTTSKDPGLWCNSAFRDADVIVVASSPPPGDEIVPHIYRNVDNHALRLLKENYPRRNKRYFAIQFPYCQSDDDLPEEARLFRRFVMPQELEKFVRNIYAVDRVRFFGSCGPEFAEAVKLAASVILRDVLKRPRNCEDPGPTTEDTLSAVLLPPEVSHDMKITNSKDNKSGITNDKHEEGYIPRHFATKIDELNLLGDNAESDAFVYRPTNNDEEFRIDQLNL